MSDRGDVELLVDVEEGPSVSKVPSAQPDRHSASMSPGAAKARSVRMVPPVWTFMAYLALMMWMVLLARWNVPTAWRDFPRISETSGRTLLLLRVRA